MSKRITDSKMKFRDRLSFMLYISLAVLSISLCMIATIANPVTLSNAFTQDEVVESLRLDVTQYAQDMCQKNNIPDDFVAQTVTYDTMHTLEESYVAGTLGASAQYNSNAFDGYLDEYKSNIVRNVSDMIDEQGIEIDSSLGSDAVYVFADNIVDYTSSKITFDYMKNVKNTIKIMRIAAFVMAVIFGIISISLIAIMSAKGGKNYRIVRNIGYSVLGTSILNIFFVGVIALVKATKNLVIYPLYIADAFINYVNASMLTLACASGALFVVFLVLAVISWKLKRDEQG